jgi:hypothetical protein
VSSDEDPAEATIRLESALERIATLAQRRSAAAAATPQVATAGESVDISAVAGRLDALIARLRGVLEP